MIRVQAPVTDGAKWGFRGSVNYSPDGTNRTGLKILPASFTAPLVRIKTIAAEVPGKYKRPPEHWFLAGNLTIVHGTWRDARSFRVPLNANSVFPIEPIATPYQIGFDAVDWLPNLTVEIYEWIGAYQTDDLSQLTTVIQTINNDIASIFFEINYLFPSGALDLSTSSPIPLL